MNANPNSGKKMGAPMELAEYVQIMAKTINMIAAIILLSFPDIKFAF